MQKRLADQQTQSKYPVTIINSDIQETKSHIEAELTINNTDLHSVSYSYPTSQRQLYGIAFIAPKGLFETTCRPIIDEVIASVEVK